MEANILSGFMDSDGFWKPTKTGLGMSFVVDYMQKHYGVSTKKEK